MTDSVIDPNTQWFRDHPIHNSIKKWFERLNNERPDNFSNLDKNSRSVYDRLYFVISYLQERLLKLNPMLVQASILNNINKNLDNVVPHWDGYRSNPSQHSKPLSDATNNLISHIQNLPCPEGIESWKDVLEKLRVDMNAAIEDAKTTIQTLQTTAGETDTKFRDTNKKLQELASDIKTQKVRLDKMITQQSESFTKAEQDRVQKFGQGQDEKKKQFDAVIAEFAKTKSEMFDQHKADMSSLIRESSDKSAAVLAKIQEQLDKAVEIVGTIVNTTMSGNYQIIANREYKNAWFMRIVALISFIAMGMMVIWAVSSIDFSKSGIDWATFAFRLSLGATFLIPGIYCAKEASRHWSSEKHNRRIALELASLDPFIVKLDEGERKKIIQKKADEYFGQRAPQEAEDISGALRDINLRGDQLIKVLERIIKVIRSK